MNATAPLPQRLALFAAPHRLPFLTGAFNLVMLPFWWAGHLAVRNGFALPLPRHDGLDGALHGPLTI